MKKSLNSSKRIVGGELVINLFVKTERQKKWLKKVNEVEVKFKNTSAQTDENN